MPEIMSKPNISPRMPRCRIAFIVKHRVAQRAEANRVVAPRPLLRSAATARWCYASLTRTTLLVKKRAVIELAGNYGTVKSILYPNDENPIVRIRSALDVAWLSELHDEVGSRLWLISGLNALREHALPKEISVPPMLLLFDTAAAMRPSCWHVTEYPSKEERSRGIPHLQYSRYYLDDGTQMVSKVYVYEGFWGPGKDAGNSEIPQLEFSHDCKIQSIIDSSLATNFGYDAPPAMAEFMHGLEVAAQSPDGKKHNKVWFSGLLRGFTGCLVAGHDGEDAYLAARPDAFQKILDRILPPAVEAITNSAWYQANRDALVWDDELGQLVLPA